MSVKALFGWASGCLGGRGKGGKGLGKGGAKRHRKVICDSIQGRPVFLPLYLLDAPLGTFHCEYFEQHREPHLWIDYLENSWSSTSDVNEVLLVELLQRVEAAHNKPTLRGHPGS